MELTTRCPACGVAFAASLAQLQLRKGYVRCVACAHIFDGYEAVVPSEALQSQAPPPQTESRPAAPIPTHPIETAPPASRQAASGDEPFWGGADSQPDEDDRAYPDEPSFRFSPNPSEDDAESADEDDDERIAVYGESRNESRPAVPGFLAGQAEPVRRTSAARAFWLVLILAGVLLALAQAVYVYRMQLAVQWPWLRPWLQIACQHLECELPYARNLKQLSISDSSLQRQGQQMVFEALLRNNLRVAQQWPVLWLELTDVSGAVQSRRYIPPDVYLGGVRPGPAFPGASEQRIAVPLDIKAEHVTGYQVGLFFP